MNPLREALQPFADYYSRCTGHRDDDPMILPGLHLSDFAKARAALALPTEEAVAKIGVLHRGREGQINFIQEVDVLHLEVHGTMDVYAISTPATPEAAEQNKGDVHTSVTPGLAVCGPQTEDK